MSELTQLSEKQAMDDTSGLSPAQPQPSTSSKPSEVPSSFRQKRRGRPPGRPNKTVKEADFEDNPIVQRWNAAKGDNPVPIPAVAINIREALPESVLTRDAQREIYEYPSREYIYFVHGWITSRQIACQRPSYVNALLIHSRGEDVSESCDQCAEKRGKNALGPFLNCRVLRGTFHDSCSNCKWFDTASACSHYNGVKPNRKRKAKGDVGEDSVVANTQPDVTESNLMASTAEADVDVVADVHVRTDVASTQEMVNGVDVSVLTLPQDVDNIAASPLECLDMPDDFVQNP